jgi:beta-phosphoglucomutase-like phosphatase (HAD superfamily)
MNISAVIFDFNGVLVDDESVHFTLFSEVLAQEGVSLSEKDYHERYLGFDDRKCFETVLIDSQKPTSPDYLDELISRKARRYIEVATQGLRFFPSAAETLRNIAAHWPVAICSGALRAEIEYSLKLLDRLDQVAAIISAEDTTRCKPDPHGYELALAAIRRHAKNGNNKQDNEPNDLADLSPFACLVVEDSLAGIIAAKCAGMRAVGVPNTYPAEQLLDAGADDIVLGLENLTPAWINHRFVL